MRAQLDAFLGMPGTCGADTLPVITQHYRNSFNATDQFDTYLGHIPYDVRVADINHICLISVIRMTLVNAYTIYSTLLHRQDVDNFAGIKSFVKEVEEDLVI